MTRSFARCLCIIALLIAGGPITAGAQTEAPSDQPKPPQAAVVLGTPQAEFPADLRFLNHKPAGVLGRVRANGDALEFADGSPARFWGVNVQAYALFRSTDTQIAYHAERLARMGVNLVRIHHHDSGWVRPNIFGNRAPDTGSIDPKSMRKIDLWVAKLREQGIYIWLDLHVGRVLTPADKGADLHELWDGKHKGDLRGYNFVNDDIKRLMQKFTESYLTHVNPFTGLAYKDDPAVAAVLITNENDLTKHFFNRIQPDRGAPAHAARYMAAAKAFSEAHKFGFERVWKGGRGPARNLFLADLEHQFHADMKAHLRGLGYDGLIAVANFWGSMPMSGLASLTEGDLIDMHSYGPHDNVYEQADLVAKISAAHVSGMPLSVSEWNIGRFRSGDRLVAPFQVSAMAAFQNWDAMMLYGYAQKPLREKKLAMGRWHGATDPSIIATLPAAALLYRQAHVAPARAHYVLTPTSEQLFGDWLSAKTVPALRHLPHQAGLSVTLPTTPELPWLVPAPIVPNGLKVTDLKTTKAPDATQTAFRHDIKAGTFVVDTAHSQVVTGSLKGGVFKLSNLTVKLAHEKGMFAVQSLGPEPLDRASELLISTALPSWPQKGRAFPFEAEPLSGVVTFTAPADLRMTLNTPHAAPGQITHQVDGTRHIITLNKAPPALWIRLSGPSSP